MEALLLEAPEIEGRRAQTAEFIQDNLQVVKNLVKDGVLEDGPEEISDEIENFQIFDHQLDAWGAVWDAREAGKDKALVHLATGLGKTSVAVFDVIKFYEEFRAKYDREPRVLFACHQKEIIEQAAERFEAFIPDLSQGFYAGTRKDSDADITFATLQSLHGSLDKFDPKEFDYIVYDEAHHSKAETFEEVVNHFNPRFQLALTATPDRLDELDIRELFGEEVYSKGLAEALAEDLLVEPSYHIVFDDAVKEALDTDFSPNSLKELRDLLDVWPRNELIAENVKEEMKKLGLELGNVKTIVFCHDIKHAEDIAYLLDAEAYHSSLPKIQRQEFLRRFRQGDLRTICVRDMFNEGIDIPDAELLVFLRSTTSPTVFEQQLGRGLRKHEGKDKVSVLDFAANIERITMIRELAESVRQYTPHDSYNSGEGNTNPSGGVYEQLIHTDHGDFDFDKMTINILDRYNALTLRPPEGWISLNAFAKRNDADHSTIYKIIKEGDIEAPLFSFGAAPSPGLSPEAQATIAEKLALRSETAPGEWVSVSRFSKELEASKRTLLKLIDEHNIPTEKHRHGTIDTISVSPEAQVQLRALVGEKAPEGYISVRSFAISHKLSPKFLAKIVEQHEVPISRHRYGSQTTDSLSPESQIMLESLGEIPQPAAEGIISLNKFAEQEDISYGRLRRLLKASGIELATYKFGPKHGLGLTSEQQDTAKELDRNAK